MKALAPYLVFAVIYGLVSSLFAVMIDYSDSGIIVPMDVVLIVATALVALLVARRCGNPTTLGITVTATVIFVSKIVCVMGVLMYVAVPALEKITPSIIIDMVGRYFAIGGWYILLYAALLIGAPMLLAKILLGRSEPPKTADA